MRLIIDLTIIFQTLINGLDQDEDGPSGSINMKNPHLDVGIYWMTAQQKLSK